MKRIFLYLSIAAILITAYFIVGISQLHAQTAVFPTGVVTDQSLGVAANAVTGLLNNSVQVSDTSLNIKNGTCTANGISTTCNVAYKINMFVTLNNEIMQICSLGSSTGVTILNLGITGSACPSISGRALDGTQVAAHSTITGNACNSSLTGCVRNNIVAWNNNAKNKEIEAIETAFSSLIVDITFPPYNADPTGVVDATAIFQTAITATAAAGKCIVLNGGKFKIVGGLSSPALGRLCILGTGTGVPYTGVISGIPPTSSTLIQYQNNAKTISLTGLANRIENLDFTIPTGVTGVTAIYVTDTLTQPVAHSKIIGNKIHGYSSGVTAGTLLDKGMDFESIGANVNFNIIQSNIIQSATYGMYIHGTSSSAVVNANIFSGNNIMNCTHAVNMQNAGEMNFEVGMEGNGDAITAIGVVAVSFDTTRGEQAPPHVIFSGSSHDNTVHNGGRCRNGGQLCYTVTSDSLINQSDDMSALWSGISASAQRWWNFGGITESANQTPNLSAIQSTSDVSGSTRSAYRIAHSTSFNTVDDFSITPQGCNSLAYCGYYMATETSYDPSKPVANFQQFGTQSGNSPYAFITLGRSGSYIGDLLCQAINTAVVFTTGCGFRVQVRGSSAQVVPLIVQGDGVYQNNLALTSAGNLPSCAAGIVGATVPNYPYATSKTRGAAPSSGGVFNVSIRCASDDGVSFAWVIQ